MKYEINNSGCVGTISQREKMWIFVAMFLTTLNWDVSSGRLKISHTSDGLMCVILPIYKKGDKTDFNNYREI